jgi:methylmalonyl-CoA/ethylmalonyl-CoA epimerase
MTTEVLSAIALTERLLGVAGAPPAAVQVAYAVSDIEEASSRWADTRGAGPFFRLGEGPMPLTDVTFRGQPAIWSHSTSVGQWGRLQIELAVQHEAAPPELSTRMGVDRLGLHHTAWFVDDVIAASSALEDHGYPLLMGARSGGEEIRFHDAMAELGHRIEIYAVTKSVQRMYLAVQQAAQGWDGSRPLRPFSELVELGRSLAPTTF